jgi:c-di-GMP-binding flagellar brake protein YcgR
MDRKLKTQFIVRLKIDPASAKDFRFPKKSVDVQAKDLSIGGVGILSSYHIPKGVVLDLEFTFNDKVIALKGEVRLAQVQEKGQTRLGIKFLDVDKKHLKLIEDFIEENERRVITRLKLI